MLPVRITIGGKGFVQNQRQFHSKISDNSKNAPIELRGVISTIPNIDLFTKKYVNGDIPEKAATNPTQIPASHVIPFSNLLHKAVTKDQPQKILLRGDTSGKQPLQITIAGKGSAQN